MSLALHFFSLLPIPVLICIAIVMYRRKQHLVFRLFWYYICFYAVALPLEFICKPISYKAFFYSYWSVSFLSVVFELLLLRDILSRTFANYPQLVGFRRRFLELSPIFVVGISALLVFNLAGAPSIPEKIAKAELTVSAVAVGVFVFVVTSSLVLGIRWRSTVCGIAAGLGLLGIVDVVAFLVLIYPSRISQNATLFSWLETLGFDGMVGIFAAYFLPRVQEVTVPKRVRPELLEWAESMKGAVRK